MGPVHISTSSFDGRSCGNHLDRAKYGAISIPLPWYVCRRASTSSIKGTGGNMYRESHSSQWRERAFTPEDKGSGNGEMKHFSLLFSLLAKRSIEKGPKLFHRILKVVRSRDHSVSMGD